MKTIPAGRPVLDKKEFGAVLSVLKSGQLAHGRKVEELEEVAANFVGSRYAIAVSSGTAALHTSLYALGIEKGDEVITSPFTFGATSSAILAVGAKPVFVDIEPSTFNIDISKIRSAITKKTKAILPISLYGLPFDAFSIRKLDLPNHIKIIEDACQSLGSSVGKKMSGNIGDISAVSLYATKVITSGEGGLIFTNNKVLQTRAKNFRYHGMDIDYEYTGFGLNYRMTNIAAAIGLTQLGKIGEFINTRRRNARLYTEFLSGMENITLPIEPKGFSHSFSQFTVRIKPPLKRDMLRAYLKENEVGTGVYYGKPLHTTPYFKEVLKYRFGDFPNAELASREVLSLPVFPEITPSAIRYICGLIRRYVENKN